MNAFLQNAWIQPHLTPRFTPMPLGAPGMGQFGKPKKRQPAQGPFQPNALMNFGRMVQRY